MTRLYSNENFPLQTVEALRNLGHDVLTSYESGKANQAIPDEDVLAYAASQGRVLVTLNRKHFIRLHNLSFDHAGIIVCTVDTDSAGLAERIDRVLEGKVSMAGQLVRINRTG